MNLYSGCIQTFPKLPQQGFLCSHRCCKMTNLLLPECTTQHGYARLTEHRHRFASRMAIGYLSSKKEFWEYWRSQESQDNLHRLVLKHLHITRAEIQCLRDNACSVKQLSIWQTCFCTGDKTKTDLLHACEQMMGCEFIYISGNGAIKPIHLYMFCYRSPISATLTRLVLGEVSLTKHVAGLIGKALNGDSAVREFCLGPGRPGNIDITPIIILEKQLHQFIFSSFSINQRELACFLYGMKATPKRWTHLELCFRERDLVISRHWLQRLMVIAEVLGVSLSYRSHIREQLADVCRYWKKTINGRLELRLAAY